MHSGLFLAVIALLVLIQSTENHINDTENASEREINNIDKHLNLGRDIFESVLNFVPPDYEKVMSHVHKSTRKYLQEKPFSMIFDAHISVKKLLLFLKIALIGSLSKDQPIEDESGTILTRCLLLVYKIPDIMFKHHRLSEYSAKNASVHRKNAWLDILFSIKNHYPSTAVMHPIEFQFNRNFLVIEFKLKRKEVVIFDIKYLWYMQHVKHCRHFLFNLRLSTIEILCENIDAEDVSNKTSEIIIDAELRAYVWLKWIYLYTRVRLMYNNLLLFNTHDGKINFQALSINWRNLALTEWKLNRAAVFAVPSFEDDYIHIREFDVIFYSNYLIFVSQKCNRTKCKIALSFLQMVEDDGEEINFRCETNIFLTHPLLNSLRAWMDIKLVPLSFNGTLESLLTGEWLVNVFWQNGNSRILAIHSSSVYRAQENQTGSDFGSKLVQVQHSLTSAFKPMEIPFLFYDSCIITRLKEKNDNNSYDYKLWMLDSNKEPKLMAANFFIDNATVVYILSGKNSGIKF